MLSIKLYKRIRKKKSWDKTEKEVLEEVKTHDNSSLKENNE